MDTTKFKTEEEKKKQNEIKIDTNYKCTMLHKKITVLILKTTPDGNGNLN